MKKLAITAVIILSVISTVWAANVKIDLDNIGVYRLKKVSSSRVVAYRAIVDANGIEHPMKIVGWWRFDKATTLRNTAFAEYNHFNNMNDVEKIAYVDGLKAVAGVKLVKWNAIVNKFNDPNDTE